VTACIVAERDPYSGYGRSREPEAYLDLFVFKPPKLSEPIHFDFPYADLYILPAPRFLEIEPTSRPFPAFAYGPEGLMAECFKIGCVDYLRDPWSLVELEARASRFLYTKISISAGALTLQGRQLFAPGTRLCLSEAEWKLLRLLFLNMNRSVPRAAIENMLGGRKKPGSRAVDVLVSSLRKKLETFLPGSSESIKTCRNCGYMLEGQACG